MTAQELGPLFEPEAVGFTFQAPGWYLLAGLLVILAIYFFVQSLRRYLKNAYRREALKQLTKIEMGAGQKSDGKLRATMLLLKGLAIQSFGREPMASLHGSDWLDFLEGSGKGTPFREYASTISDALYRGEKAEEKQEREIDRKKGIRPQGLHTTTRG